MAAVRIGCLCVRWWSETVFEEMCKPGFMNNSHNRISRRTFLRQAALGISAVTALGMAGEPLPILGLASVGLLVSDLEKSRAFYHNVLGFEEAFDAKSADGSVSVAFFKVNDHQFIELSPGLTPGPSPAMTHIALLTDDLETLRRLLEKRGAKPGAVGKRLQDGNLSCAIHDLPGQNLKYLEFVQYLPNSPEIQSKGKSLGPNRISLRFDHAGIIATDYAAARAFYVETFGCREIWSRRQKSGQPVIDHLMLPGMSGDFLELSNKPQPLSRSAAGGAAHFALTVPDVKAGYRVALERDQGRIIPPRFGMDKRWQFNMFDPDGTRVECMQPESPDGTP